MSFLIICSLPFWSPPFNNFGPSEEKDSKYLCSQVLKPIWGLLYIYLLFQDEVWGLVQGL